MKHYVLLFFSYHLIKPCSCKNQWSSRKKNLKGLKDKVCGSIHILSSEIFAHFINIRVLRLHKSSLNHQTNCKWLNNSQIRENIIIGSADVKALYQSLHGHTCISHSSEAVYRYLDVFGVLFRTEKNWFTQHSKHLHDTVLSKCIRDLKDSDTDFSIKWSIVTRARSYRGNPSRCNLCSAFYPLTNQHFSTRYLSW